MIETRSISRDDVRKFAAAIGATAPVHLDVLAARAAGYPDLLAPAYFFVSLGLSFGRIRPRAAFGAEGLPLDDDLAGRRVVAGETRVEWLGDMFAGDEIAVEQLLVNVTRKSGRSGDLELYEYERTYRRGNLLLVRECFVRIAR